MQCHRFMCAISGFIQAHDFGGRPVGRYQEEESQKPFAAGKRGNHGRRYKPIEGGKS